MFQAIRSGLNSGANSFYSMIHKGASPWKSWTGAIGGGILERAAGLSNTSMSAIGGTAAGGIYGAFSDDTSVLGGMAKGAVLGAGAYGAYRSGSLGYRAYNKIAPKHGAGKAAAAAFQIMGRDAKRNIANSYTRALNGFKALGGGKG